MLEKKIKDHAAEIFGAELPEGHRNMFVKILDNQTQSRRTRIIRLMSVIAVSAAAVTAVIVLLTFPKQGSVNGDNEPFNEISNYYSMLLDDEIATAVQELQCADATVRNEVMTDMESIRHDPLPFNNEGEQNEELLISAYSSRIKAVKNIRDNLKFLCN